MISLSALLNPKVFGPILGVIALISLGLKVRAEIIDYGDARELAGKTKCEAAVTAKATADKAALDAATDAGAAEAAETQTVYVEVTKEVAVQDATIIAENTALKTELEALNERIDNAPDDITYCARQPIPADSLLIHTKIDDLLAGR